MAKKPAPTTHIIANRRARFDFALHDELQVGIVLSGPEVKAVRNGRVSLRGSYVNLKDGELWLTNASFSVTHTKPGEASTAVDTSPRKLLANKREIAQLQAAKDQNLTIVPVRMTTRTRFIKVVIATAKGKKRYDKRQVIKKRDQERENKKLLKLKQRE